MTAIDVVVPCYNYAHYLETCVSSILGQTGVDVRVLIVDDCSTDDTAPAAAALAAKDGRVTAVRNNVNLGLIGTANRGMLEWAQAPYSLLISADDALTPGALARAVELLERHPEAGFVFGTVVVFDSDPPPPVPSPETFAHRVMDGAWLIEHICHNCNDVPTPTAVVRTELQKRVGGYNPRTPHTSDMEMWLRMGAYAKVGVVQAAQGYYRVHGANMSGLYFSQPTRDAEQRLLAAEQAMAAVGSRVPEFPRILRTMRRIEAERAYWRAGLAFEAGEQELGDTFLRFATTTDPSPRSSPGFWSASAKRTLGAGAIRRMRRLAGRPVAVLGRDQLVPGIELKPGQLWGWQPEAECAPADTQSIIKSAGARDAELASSAHA